MRRSRPISAGVAPQLARRARCRAAGLDAVVAVVARADDPRAQGGQARQGGARRVGLVDLGRARCRRGYRSHDGLVVLARPVDGLVLGVGRVGRRRRRRPSERPAARPNGPGRRAPGSRRRRRTRRWRRPLSGGGVQGARAQAWRPCGGPASAVQSARIGPTGPIRARFDHSLTNGRPSADRRLTRAVRARGAPRCADAGSRQAPGAASRIRQVIRLVQTRRPWSSVTTTS